MENTQSAQPEQSPINLNDLDPAKAYVVINGVANEIDQEWLELLRYIRLKRELRSADLGARDLLDLIRS